MSKATEITVCVFTETGKNKALSFNSNGEIIGIQEGNLNDNERAAYNGALLARDKLSAPIPVSVWICPQDYDVNPQQLQKQNINFLPAILITAYYPEGTQRQYVLFNNVLQNHSWSQDEVYKHLKALYDAKFGSGNQSIVCKIFPPLCNVGAYLWLAAAGVSIYKTAEQKKNPALQTAWGAASILCLEAFMKGGGFEKIFKKK